MSKKRKRIERYYKEICRFLLKTSMASVHMTWEPIFQQLSTEMLVETYNTDSCITKVIKKLNMVGCLQKLFKTKRKVMWLVLYFSHSLLRLDDILGPHLHGVN